MTVLIAAGAFLYLLAMLGVAVRVERLERRSRDAALRCGVAVIRAKQDADRAERAAGSVTWPERLR